MSRLPGGNDPEMIQLRFEDEIGQRCPRLVLGVILCGVANRVVSDELEALIEAATSEIAARTALDETRRDPRIAATREAYKACGKDPNRYRPSAEALRRRVVLGKGLYRVNTVVDVLNLVSLRTGFSIGGFDAGRIVGGLRYGIGRNGEPYEAIGRGAMNIEGLPVLRDEAGPVGTPTSDHERTKVTPETRRFLMVFHDFGGDAGLGQAMAEAADLLERHAEATDVQRTVLGP